MSEIKRRFSTQQTEVILTKTFVVVGVRFKRKKVNKGVKPLLTLCLKLQNKMLNVKDLCNPKASILTRLKD